MLRVLSMPHVITLVKPWAVVLLHSEQAVSGRSTLLITRGKEITIIELLNGDYS